MSRGVLASIDAVGLPGTWAMKVCRESSELKGRVMVQGMMLVSSGLKFRVYPSLLSIFFFIVLQTKAFLFCFTDFILFIFTVYSLYWAANLVVGVWCPICKGKGEPQICRCFSKGRTKIRGSTKTCEVLLVSYLNVAWKLVC